MHKRSLEFSNQKERNVHSIKKINSIESLGENKYRKQKIEKSPSFHSSPSVDGDMWM